LVHTVVATSGRRSTGRGGIGGATPLDRINAQVRRDAAAMRAGCVQQRLTIVEQRAAIRRLQDRHEAMKQRLRRRRLAP